MTKYNSGTYIVKNPQKYIGSGSPVYRSSWELTFMQTCDNHPNVLQWASESIRIPYINPFTKKATTYVPDFLVVYLDKTGKQFAELIEIKPISQSLTEHAKSRYDKLAIALNQMKWHAAELYCRKYGLKFRVITEHQLYRTLKK